MHHHTKFGYKGLNGSGDTVRTNTCDTSNLTYNLDLEHSNPIFHRAFQLMMMYHQIRFGSKRIKGLEDIVETIIF